MDFDDYQYIELLLDSRNSYSMAYNIPNTDWGGFYFTQPLENIAAIKIVQAEIPFSYYIMNSSNNSFTIQDAGGTFPFTIPIGNYNAADLTSALTTGLNTSGTAITYTITFSPSTGKFTITSPSLSGFILMLENDKPMIGFTSGNWSATIIGATATLVAPNFAEITGPNFVYLCSNSIGVYTNCFLAATSTIGSGNDGPQMTRIPVNFLSGDIIYYNDPTPNHFFDMLTTTQLQRFDLYLTSGTSTVPLSLNGLSFTVKIGLYIRRTISNEPTPKRSGIVRN
jgi:hypothetical protein